MRKIFVLSILAVFTVTTALAVTGPTDRPVADEEVVLDAAESGSAAARCDAPLSGATEGLSGVPTEAPAGIFFPFCTATTQCSLGGEISCESFSDCREQNGCWVWCDGYLERCPGVHPQYCPEAPNEY